jgi:hypothetical protein
MTYSFHPAFSNSSPSLVKYGTSPNPFVKPPMNTTAFLLVRSPVVKYGYRLLLLSPDDPSPWLWLWLVVAVELDFESAPEEVSVGPELEADSSSSILSTAEGKVGKVFGMGGEGGTG